MKLICKLKCVACENIIQEWYIRDKPTIWKFFSKCDACKVNNVFYAPKHLSLKEVVTHAHFHKKRGLLPIEEVDRLQRIRKNYEVPQHIPTAQLEKYRTKKRDKIIDLWKA